MSLNRKEVGDEDIVRIVYSCHDQAPSGEATWGEEVGQVKEPQQKTG